ncbi:tail fiber/spike domain-containing protein, partial [Klebsiella oxytoca]
MTNMTESPSWEDSIELIARSERVSGGQDGVANRPLKKLANRTLYLKEKYDGLNTDLSGKVEAVKTFAGGAVLNSPREEILFGMLRLVWTGIFPKEVAPGSSPQTTGGVGVGAWAYTSDAVIRHDLASYLGPSFMGMPEGGTLFDLLGGWVCPEMYGATAGDESAAHANSKAFYRLFEVLRRRGGGVIYMKPGATYCVDFINFVPANVRIHACGATIKHI